MAKNSLLIVDGGKKVKLISCPYIYILKKHASNKYLHSMVSSKILYLYVAIYI